MRPSETGRHGGRAKNRLPRALGHGEVGFVRLTETGGHGASAKNRLPRALGHGEVGLLHATGSACAPARARRLEMA